jgi:hypothetical protein
MGALACPRNLLVVLIAILCSLVSLPVWADSLSLLSDLEFRVNNSETTDKGTTVETEQKQTVFAQIYTLDMRKELFPTLQLSTGGLFGHDKTRNDSSDPTIEDTELLDVAMLPYIDLQLQTALLEGTLGYRKNERKQSRTNTQTERTYKEEYNSRLSWTPVALPSLNLAFTRTLTDNNPVTFDQRVDSYLLRSRYDYSDFKYSYDHTSTDTRNQLTDSDATSLSDRGVVRFNRDYANGRLNVASNLRINRQQSEFSGPGDRRIATTNRGSLFGTRNDNFPENSDPDDGFSLADVDLLEELTATLEQFSFGLDFTALNEIDTLLVNFTDLGNSTSEDFVWSIYSRNSSAENWIQVTPVVDSTDHAGNRFVLSFPKIKTQFIKVVTRQIVASGEDLHINSLTAEITLPPDVDKYTSTDWTGDLVLNWKISDDTSSGFNFLYREARTKPLDEKETLYSIETRLAHRFNDVFKGNLQASRDELRERDQDTITSHDFSATLIADYLDTFGQRLTYRFSHENDEESQNSFTNAVLLRNNLDLYQGWSLFVDNGYNIKDESGNIRSSTLLRLGSNITPNSWLNLTLSYDIDWTRTENEPVKRDQEGRLVINWVPSQTLSMTADLSYTDKNGIGGKSTVDQRYFIGWSPLRDGTLSFSLSYSRTEDDNDERTESFSPRLRWQLNRKTLLSLDYSIGEREDLDEIISFEIVKLALRIFY